MGPSQSDVDTNMVYIGTYTKKEGHVDGKAEGIYLMRQFPENGHLELLSTAAEVVNPSFVKVSRDKEYLYAVSELGPGDADSGFLYSYRIKPDNSLEEICEISTEAFAPCHIETDKTGKYVFVSNYVGGVVVMYEKQTDGSLQMKQKITLDPEKSHAHSVSIPSDNSHAYVADLGQDRIWIYDLDEENGRLVPNGQHFIQLKEGAGPRHFTFSKNENFAYSINELNSSVTAFQVKADGALEIIQNISSLPEGFEEKNSAADIHLHPSGKFLYVSNRGHNSITAFKIDENSGELFFLNTTSTEGETPRNFAISPDGNFLYAANQDTGSIAEFSIDESSGALQLLEEPVDVKTAVCIEFMD